MPATSPARIAIPLTLSVSPIRQTGGRIQRLTGATMGTAWSVKFVAADAAAASLRAPIEAALDRVIAQMSPWEAGSDLSRFNASTVGSWQTLPAEFTGVIGCALRIAEETDGAYDPTMGGLVDLWGFGAAPPPSHPPAPDAIDRARPACGWRRLEFDAIGGRLRRLSDVRLDLNGIAKGYAVDLAAATLRERGIQHALVEIGGELSGAGVKPDGTPWWVAIDRPRADLGSEVLPLVALHQLAIATSGIERSFISGGQQFSHTIDPRTGMPIDNGMVTATVLHASCMEADAYATALMVMGPEAGMAFAKERELAVLCLFRSDDGGSKIAERISPALEAMLA
jgi:thiamine biosynthesis lipoprotein